MLLLLSGCMGDGVGPGWSHPLEVSQEAAPPATITPGTWPTFDVEPQQEEPESQTEELPAFDEVVDVVVIGSGPAGAAAAITAAEAGVNVLLLERSSQAGVGITLASRAFGVGTTQQTANGISDTPESAAAEWASITGASGALPGVADFLAHSGETLAWLEAHGAQVTLSPTLDPDAGSVLRMHNLRWGDGDGGDVLLAAYTGELRLNAEVLAPVSVGAGVSGVTWRDLTTGEEATIGARAVVVATGGFLRDSSLVAAVLPEAAERTLLLETNPTSDGGGLPFLDAVGAASLNPENVGVYVHSIQDPAGAAGEALVAMGADEGVYVDSAGARFADEGLTRSFDLYALLPEGDIFAVLTAEQAASLSFMRPYYNWADPDAAEIPSLAEVAALPGAEVWSADTLSEAATLAGIDPDGLAATVDAWNDGLAAGEEDPFGRDLTDATALDGDGWVVLRLLPGLAKNFGGVATDTQARVLDSAGNPIPGLYAAGEVTGMLLAGGGGGGFSGSVTACYRGGLVAGREAAALTR